MAPMSTCLAIFVKICRHWVTRLSLARSGGMSRGRVGVLPATFLTVRKKNSHQLLVLSKNLLYYLCSSCCSWWCCIYRWGTVYHNHLVLKFPRNAVYNVFRYICLYVPRLSENQFSGFGEFLMGFEKMCFEWNPHFLDCVSKYGRHRTRIRVKYGVAL